MFKAIKIFFDFLYHFFFIDQATGAQSHTKFFGVCGYIEWLILFPYAVMHGSQATMDLWLVFGAVIIGNRTLNVWMQSRAGVTPDPDATWKGVKLSKPAVVPKTDDLVQ